MEFTLDNLTSLYKRTMEYSKARFGKEADRIEVLDDGWLKLVFDTSCCGEYNEDYEYITPDVLTSDLEAVYQERKERERIEKEKAEAKLKQRQQMEAEQNKNREINQLIEFMKKYPEKVSEYIDTRL